ncbi:MAG: ATP-binding protein [Kiritimatiellae bacterium]|nr:ATP-binding protein [Kiritimatiellia bacterium]
MVARVLPASSEEELERLLARHDPTLVLADLRDGEGGRVVMETLRRWPNTLCIAMGDHRSEPVRLARDAGCYAVAPLDPDPWQLQSLVERGLESLQLRREIERLRRQAPTERVPLPFAAAETGGSGLRSAAPLWHLSLAMRNIENLDALFTRTVDGIAAAMLLSRVGVFARSRADGVYRLVAGAGCLDETRATTYEPDDWLVRWMSRHAHLISRPLLAHLSDPDEVRRLSRALDAMGAEAIAPFFARGRLYGWLFVGRRATGAPFTYADLEELSVLAGHVAIIIDNAHLYDEAARERALAETLLRSLPTGIIAAGPDGTIQWCNTDGARIAGRKVEELIGQPVEAAGIWLADALRRALAGEEIAGQNLADPATGRHLFLTTRRLAADSGTGHGAVALIEDRTEALKMAQRVEEAERAAFWSDLAAAMSHEIRNPLTAIKTFAQLLPERHADAEFREQFRRVVEEEVGRLEDIVAAIHAYAHPPERRREPVEPAKLLAAALDRARRRFEAPGARVELCAAPDAPTIEGDANALADALAHLMVNALESSPETARLHVVAAANRVTIRGTDHLLLMVRDNGPGIADSVRDRLFSPFGTTKPKGLGLGLPIVRRIVLDHGGRLQVDSCEHGTRVTIVLPLVPPPTPDATTPASPANEPTVQIPEAADPQG